jgi:hypothetical protein
VVIGIEVVEDVGFAHGLAAEDSEQGGLLATGIRWNEEAVVFERDAGGRRPISSHEEAALFLANPGDTGVDQNAATLVLVAILYKFNQTERFFGFWKPLAVKFITARGFDGVG